MTEEQPQKNGYAKATEEVWLAMNSLREPPLLVSPHQSMEEAG